MMKNITGKVESEFLPDEGDSWDGGVAMETTFGELAELGYRTRCGSLENKAFKAVSDAGFSDRIVRCWVNESDKFVSGVVMVSMSNHDEALRIEDAAFSAGGSLRFNGDSPVEGFLEFEVE